MNAFKDKVTDKLTRILADSSSSSPKFRPPESPPVLGSQSDRSVRSLSKEEPCGTEQSLSSYLYSFIPTVSLDGYMSNTRRKDLRPFRSLSNKGRSKSFPSRDEQLDIVAKPIPPCESEETPDTSEQDENGSSVLGKSDSVKQTHTPHVSTSYLCNILDESSFVTADLCNLLHSALPNIVKGCQWVLLYSTSRDGISLRTLIRKSADLPGHCLLIAGDMQGAVFGGLLDAPLKPTAKRKYQGTNQTFVFTTICDQPKLFRAAGVNRYYYMCLNDILAFGGGGNFALRLDEDLLQGTSGPSDTFGNSCLAHSSEFELKNVELWGFTHASQYLT